MTRIGSNPARGKRTSYRPSKVTAAMLTYVPNQEGYFRSKLDVVRLALASLIAHTPPETDILVFDNGSCPEMVDHLRSLRDAGKIQYLILSATNIGKIAALKVLFDAAPGDFVAYADDDIFFFPGWLEAHEQVFQAFGERAGMVSGVPVRNAATYARASLDRYLNGQGDADIQVSVGRFIPDDWETDWARSTGRDPQEHLNMQGGRQDICLTAGRVQAYGGANHFQFMARKQVLLAALPADWSGMLMGQMVEMDERIDRQGRLRLSTTERMTRHMGNVLEDDLRQEASALGVDVAMRSANLPRKKHWLFWIPGMGRFAHWLYDRLFTMINEVQR